MSAKTRAEVTVKVRALEDVRAITRLTTSPLSRVQDWLEHWLTTIASTRVRPRTLESYRSLVTRHITPAIGHHQLEELQPEHLEQLYANLLAGGLGPGSVLRGHRVLSRAIKVAHQRQRVRRDVTRLVEPPPQRRSHMAKPLSLPEARAVLAAAAEGRNAARWSVALALGLRQSEALALRWADLNLDTGTLSVHRSVHRVTGRGLVYEEPKTDRSRRTLVLPRPLTTALRAHRTEQALERRAARARWQDNDLLFAQPNGRPLDKNSDYDAWCRLLRTAGVAHVRLHDARHTAATLLLAEGVHARVVMELLGHSQMRTTTDIYSHVMPALARDAADLMGDILLTPTRRLAATGV